MSHTRVIGPGATILGNKIFATRLTARGLIKLTVEARTPEGGWAAMTGTATIHLDDVPLSPPLSGPYSWEWNASGLVGVHVLTAVGPGHIPMGTMVFGVPVTGPQRLPALFPFSACGGTLSPFHQRPGVQWVDYPGYPTLPKPSPIMVTRVPADTPSPPRVGGWYIEPISGPRHAYNQPAPQFLFTPEGQPWVGPWYPQSGQLSENALNSVAGDLHLDGPRGVGSVNPYATYRPDPTGTYLAYGLDLSGRFYRLHWDGTVETLFGPRRNPQTWELDILGEYRDEDPPCKGPNDFVFDFVNPGIVYIADTEHHRICWVDLRGPVPVIDTLLGGTNQPGHIDGPGREARFNRPYSIEIHGPHPVGDNPNGVHLYIADRDNNAIRRTNVHLLGQTPVVETQIGAGLFKPQVIRWDSQFNTVIGETGDQAAIKRWVWRDNRLDTITTTPGGLGAPNNVWVWLDVDRQGRIGPVDAIYWVVTGTLNKIIGVSIDGTSEWSWTGSSPLGHGPLNQVSDAVGHYPWAISIIGTGILTSGMGSVNLSYWRPRLTSDYPRTWDLTRYYAGRGRNDTIAMVQGVRGYNRLGLPTFDELAGWSDWDLREYARRWWPAATDEDIGAWVYFVRMESERSRRMAIPLTFAPAPPGPTVPVPIIQSIQVRVS